MAAKMIAKGTDGKGAYGTIDSRVSASGRAERARGGDVGLRRKAAVLGCVIVVIAFVLGALFGDRGILHLAEKRRRALALEQEIARLEGENRRLAASIDWLRKDPRAVEAIAREELGLVKPGETVFLIQDDDRR
jgi:cell division protein FtsB